MKNAAPRVRRLTCVAGILLLTCAVAFAPHHEGQASETNHIDAEFEALGVAKAASGLPLRVRHVPTGIILRYIPAGSFTMGTPATESHRDRDEEPRQVTIAQAFYLGETEITIAQWHQVVGADLPREAVHKDSTSLPVGGVSWYAAKNFCNLLNSRGGQTGWRLPTEIEWEYACRAGTTTAFSFGQDITTAQANFDGRRPYVEDSPAQLNRGKPVPVRSLPANAWGLHETHGNLWEWCEDPYVVKPSAGVPTNPKSGASRVIRGGAYTSKAKQLRSGYRDGYPPSSSGPKYGFRLVKSIPGGH